MQAKSISISFSEYSVPEFKEGYSNEKWVSYGANNLYPNYLLDLYRRSPKHGAIIRNKASYILGKGFKYKQDGADDALLNAVNKAGESLNEIGKKIALDQCIFGGFYLSVTWGKGKQIVDVSHVDYTKIRSNRDNTIFYFKAQGWKSSATNNKPKEYLAYDPLSPKGTQILYFKEYTPGLDTYTLPEYIQGLNHIEADALVAEHVLNNAKTGFTASKMINFFNGDPTEEQKTEIEQAIKKKYTGYKGSKIIISFNDDPTKAPQVLDLGASDLTKEDFEQVDNLISQNIFTVHNVTSPMLFGVRVPGQLGGRSELIEAFELFKSIWADEKQTQTEEVVNEILKAKGMEEVMLIPKEPIGLDLFGNSKLFEMLPVEYIYEKMGIKIEDHPEIAQVIERKKKEMVEPPPEPMPQAKPKFSADDDDRLFMEFAQVGEPSKDYVVLKKKKECSLRFSDDIVAHERMEFDEISQHEANVLDMIRKDKRVTAEVLAETLKVPVVYVQRILEGLESKGLLKSKSERIGQDVQIERFPTKETPKVLQERKPLTTEVYIKYSYEGPEDERNRDFCARMMDLDRFYSRAEIETISQRVGYSVWERRGGFYHNPNTGETTPYCRHKWVQNIVIKRK